MKEIICLNCRSKILREDVQFCHNCGGNLLHGVKGTYLECCKKRVPEYEFCRFCPYCGKETGHLSPEQVARFREKDRRSREEQRRIEEGMKKRLTGVRVKTSFTRCEYQGSPEHMLSALHRDHERNNLIAEAALKEMDRVNRVVILSTSEEQLEAINKFLGPTVRKELARADISEAKITDIQDQVGRGSILLSLPTQLMSLSLNYINRLFLASVFDLDESLINAIEKLLLNRASNQNTFLIFDYLDQDENGHFRKRYEERIKLYKKEGTTVEDFTNERNVP